jgi:hypothetical protein
MNATDPIDTARLSLALGDLRLPAIKVIWPDFADRADKEGWPAARFLAALTEHEIAERSRRRIERHLDEARLPPGKTLESFEFEVVPMVGKAQVMALVAGDIWLEKGANLYSLGLPAAASRTCRPLSATLWWKMAGGFCSPEPPTWFRNFRSPGVISLWNPPSPSWTSIIC